ncbi:MAG: hypothetical protein OEM58_09050 [Nitrospirota bacterium]|nr:hypothetical protein [Nitrospirota bacterium]
MQEGRAPVAGSNHVLEGAGEGTTRFSTHSRNLQEEGPNKSILMADPTLGLAQDKLHRRARPEFIEGLTTNGK